MAKRLHPIDSRDVLVGDRLTVDKVPVTVAAIGPHKIIATQDSTGSALHLDRYMLAWKAHKVCVPAPIDTAVPVDADHAVHLIRSRPLWRAAQGNIRRARHLLASQPTDTRNSALMTFLADAAETVTAGYTVRSRALMTGAHHALCAAVAEDDPALIDALVDAVGTRYLRQDDPAERRDSGRLLVAVETPDGPLALGTVPADDPREVADLVRAHFPGLHTAYRTRPLATDETAHYPA